MPCDFIFVLRECRTLRAEILQVNLFMCLGTVQAKAGAPKGLKQMNLFNHQNNIHSNIYSMPYWEG